MKKKLTALMTSDKSSEAELHELWESDPGAFATAAASTDAAVLAALAGNQHAVEFLIDHHAFAGFPLVTIAEKHLGDVTAGSFPCLRQLAQMLPPDSVRTRLAFVGTAAFSHVLAGASTRALTELYLYPLRNLVSKEARAVLLDAGAIQDAIDDGGMTVAHRAAAWGDEECWGELPPALQRCGSQNAIEIAVKIDGGFHRLKAPAGSTPAAVAAAAQKVAAKAGSNEGITRWKEGLERLRSTMDGLPKKAPCTAAVQWKESAVPEPKKLKGDLGDVVSDGHVTGRVIMSDQKSRHGVLVRTEVGGFHWLMRCWPLPKKPKAKPTAGDIKKIIGTLDKAKPIGTLVDELRVKYSEEGFALLRWGALAADPRFLHRGFEAQQDLTEGLLPVEDDAMLKALVNCGKGGVIEGSGPGLQLLLRKIASDSLRERLPSLPLEAQLAYAIVFPEHDRSDALRPWVLKQIEKGWNRSGWGRSDVGELMRRFAISHEELPVDKLLSSTSVDVFEWAPLLVALPKGQLLKLIRKRSSTMQSALTSTFLKERRGLGDSWEDSVEIVEACKKRFSDSKYRHWGSLIYSAAGPVPDWAVETLPSTTRLTKDAHLEQLSASQLESLAKAKAEQDVEFRMLVLGEEVTDVPAASIRAPRFAATKETFAAALENTLKSAMRESKGRFDSKEERIHSYRRLVDVVRKYSEALLEMNDGVLDQETFDMLLPGRYAHLDAPARRSLLPDRPTKAMQAMTLKRLETYYSRWALTFPSRPDFYKHFAADVLAQPPTKVFATLQ